MDEMQEYKINNHMLHTVAIFYLSEGNAFNKSDLPF